MKQKISAQLAAGFAFIVLITVAVISVTANGLISRQFEQYVAQQRKMSSEQLAQSLSFQYHAEDGTWNVDYIHGLGICRPPFDPGRSQDHRDSRTHGWKQVLEAPASAARLPASGYTDFSG